MVIVVPIIHQHRNCSICAIAWVLWLLMKTVIYQAPKKGFKRFGNYAYRDRNHPSIFMWCMENEEAIQGTVTGTRILETMVETTHRIDPTAR